MHFKINREMTPQSVNNMFNNISDFHDYQTRGSLQDNYFRIPINEQITKTAISYSGLKLRNDIPGSIRDSPSLETFKKISRIAFKSIQRLFLASSLLFFSIPFYFLDSSISYFLLIQISLF